MESMENVASGRRGAELMVDLLADDFLNDPYRTFGVLRETQPVFWSPQLQAWLVTRYDDVTAFLTDPRVSASRVVPRLNQFPEHLRQEFAALIDMFSKWPLMLDRPEHGQYRPVISRALARPIIESFRPLVQRLVRELLEPAKKRGYIDWMSEFAEELPLNVVSEIIGVPVEGRALFKRCAIDIVTFFGTSPTQYVELATRAKDTIEEALVYLTQIVAERRLSPRKDLISGLIQAQADGIVRGESEILATCVMMAFAGFETTTNLLANGLLTMLRHPDEMSRLRSDPTLMKSAIDEMLRFETPVQRLSRQAIDDIHVDGQTIRRGDLMFLMAASANRDPNKFREPDKFDIGRDSSGHLAFGYSIHTCPGLTLAHMEASIVFQELLETYPTISLAVPKPQWRRNLSVRSLERLPIAFT